ncbi:MAG: hypothetical protein JHC26_08840 [Thermofilum sp.]|jgi:hypothetical protein|uniref:hypothetical protein n=1 Tax=Thermofilum sp. TaxID=1961369 RepID=UPI00258D2110|nr:hypothetical protein [Thermofilum sp.]MCI4409184.1 hypothetical protein [Thermofilum sp.]
MSVKSIDAELGEALFRYINGSSETLPEKLKTKEGLARAIAYLQKQYGYSPSKVIEILKAKKQQLQQKEKNIAVETGVQPQQTVVSQEKQIVEPHVTVQNMQAETDKRGKVFNLFTWGSCRYGALKAYYPRYVDFEAWTRRGGTHETEIPGVCKISYTNNDSNKNMHRYVEIVDIYSPMVIKYYGNSSCSYSFEEVYVVTKRDGKIVYEEPEVKTESVVEERGKYRVTLEKRYVELDGKKVYIDEREVEKVVIPEKLRVTLKKQNDRILVVGDTFHVKDKLKALGFKWDPLEKAWYTTSGDIETLKTKLEQKLGDTGIQVEIQQ